MWVNAFTDDGNIAGKDTEENPLKQIIGEKSLLPDKQVLASTTTLFSQHKIQSKKT